MITDALCAMKQHSKKTIEEISELSGIPKGTLNKIFSGQTLDPKYETLKQLVHTLGFSIDDIERLQNEKIKRTSESIQMDTEAEDEKWLVNLLVERGYINPGEDISERDADFLIHWIGLLDAWFEKP